MSKDITFGVTDGHASKLWLLEFLFFTVFLVEFPDEGVKLS